MLRPPVIAPVPGVGLLIRPGVRGVGVFRFRVFRILGSSRGRRRSSGNCSRACRHRYMCPRRLCGVLGGGAVMGRSHRGFRGSCAGSLSVLMYSRFAALPCGFPGPFSRSQLTGADIRRRPLTGIRSNGNPAVRRNGWQDRVCVGWSSACRGGKHCKEHASGQQSVSAHGKQSLFMVCGATGRLGMSHRCCHGRRSAEAPPGGLTHAEAVKMIRRGVWADR